ncbi:MAG: glycosyltransferase family 2 protein [Janthinobacterium lividum]
MQLLSRPIPLSLRAAPPPPADAAPPWRPGGHPAWPAIPAWQAALPDAARGRWCLLRVGGMPPGNTLRLRLADRARGHAVRELFLRRPNPHAALLEALLHVPAEAGALDLDGFGAGEPVDARLAVLSRPEAALRLLAAGLARLPAALRGSPLGLPGRVRATLGRAAAGERPGYADWCARFDRWTKADRTGLLDAAREAPPIHAMVLGEDGPARAATLRSLDAQWRSADSLAGSLAGVEAGYVAILAAGEVLAPHALALAAARLAASAAAGVVPGIVHADEDRLRPDGTRHAPLFRPAPGEALLLAGLLTRGLVLVHAPLLDPVLDAALPAEAVRLRAWLRAGPRALPHHLPFVLAHRRPDAPAAEAATAAVAQAYLGARGAVAAAHPLRILRHPAGHAGISVIVPSACRSGHVPRCLARLLAGTGHPIREVLVAVSRVDPADRRQRRVLRRVARLPGVRVLDLGLPAFNYSRVNNLAVAQATGDTLLLLNDDVAPLRRPAAPGRPDPRLWLSTMAAHLEDPGVGAVGARLLYGDGRVQHGGVVLGLGGLAEHADRLRPGRDPGPHGLAFVDREVSAATAACLLIRRATWEALGGMDERFAVALNDVDLCLRLRTLGLGVRQANTAELVHYESLSLGRHYAGERAGLEAREVRLLRALHGPALAADPFHSASLSLELGAEHEPAFPPREASMGSAQTRKGSETL